MAQASDNPDSGQHSPELRQEKFSVKSPDQLWNEIVALRRASVASSAPAAPVSTDDAAPQMDNVEPDADVHQSPAGVNTIDTSAPEQLHAASPQSEEEVVEWLKALPPLVYDRKLREKAKELGVKVKTLDLQVREARKGADTAEVLPFQPVEPWPAPVNPAQLLDLMVATLLRVVVMTVEQAISVVLWIALTWFIAVVEVAVLLLITAPERACGKSQLLTFVSRLVARALSAANSSPSFLFRSISLWRPTILIDEGDTFFANNDELKGMINAGHTRANAFVGRTVVLGDGYSPVLFDVWGAKAIAGISLEKVLPGSTMSRGLVVRLRRKLPHENAERLRDIPQETFEEIASMLARFAEDYSEQVRDARPPLPDALSDRDQDNWEPLLAIAQCAGPEWLDKATKAAVAMSSTDTTSFSTGNELLADIAQVFSELNVSKLRTTDLLDALTRDDEKGWATYNHGRPLNPRQLAKLLGSYGIGPKTVRHGNETPKGYERSQFDDAFARYVPPQMLLQRGNVPPPVDDDDMY